MSKIIELRNLNKSYNGVGAVKGVNLAIEKGEFVTFLGPSGCGKTTTLRMIAGFEKPTSGEVLFNGKNIALVPPHLRNVNTVFQKYALFPHLNVIENVAFGLKLKRIPTEVEKKGKITVKKLKIPKSEIAAKVKRALKIVGLTGYEKRDVSSLSGGQQQRVAIARAIVNEPEILLLDEPLGALDLKMRQEMQLELRHMHRELGITFIYVTHDQEEALTMSTTIVVMRDGEICQIGAPADIYNDPINAYVADFIGESNIIDGFMPEDNKVSCLGKEWECVDGGFKKGESVDVVFRPEDFVIRKAGGGIIDGVITSSIFKGVHFEMTCKAGGYELLLHNTKDYPVGSTVGLYIKPYDIHIMRKEHYTNEIKVDFTSEDTLAIEGKEYPFDKSALLSDAQNPADEILAGKSGLVSVDFHSVELMDNEDEAPLSGNVYSMIYKGKNYLVTVKTDSGEKYYADTEYLWDDGDRVALKIESASFKLIRVIE